MNRVTKKMMVSVRPTTPVIGRRLQVLIDAAWTSDEFDFNKFKSELNEELRKGIPDSPKAESPWLFLVSLLLDLESWGAKFEAEDSGLDVIMPIYDRTSTSPEIQSRIRESMMRLKQQENRYKSISDIETAADFLSKGEIKLCEVTPERADLLQIFKEGVTTWSMPYRTREGRSKRFIVEATNKTNVSAPIGILEIGDDAPHNPVRDLAMGFTKRLSEISEIDRIRIADRFAQIRSCLKVQSDQFRPDWDLERLFSIRGEIKNAGVGRTVESQLAEKKGLTYLARLVSAEAACRQLTGYSDADFAEGLRVLRDLSIPRTTTEMTICGALPPFGELLVGKLVAMMGVHPLVRGFVDRDFGSITSSIFHTNSLQTFLPNHGVIFVTTKGLYPGHSSQYNGVTYPGINGRSVKLKKLGDTAGETSSHLSNNTMKLASQTIDSIGTMKISRLYGSGGAKRQRTIAEAVRLIGLPTALTHAYVSRPVYGFSLVSNLEDVLLYNDSPAWLVKRYEDLPSVESAEIDITDEWRRKWLGKALQRNGISF